MRYAARRRLEWVDAARGVAALSVTVYHFQIGGGFAHALHVPILSWLDWPGSRLAVPLFFVISGFSIHYAEHEKISGWVERPVALRSYFSRRLWRIYPPYVAALLLAIGVGWVQGKSISVSDLTAHLLMVHQFFPTYFNSINVVLWSIGVEMWLYLLYPFALRLLETRGMRTAGMTIFLVSAISVAVTAAISPVPNVVGMWLVSNVFFGWCMGAAVAEGVLRHAYFFRSLRWWLAGVVLLILHLGLYFSGAFADWLWPVSVPSAVVLSTWGLSVVMLLEERRAEASGERGLTLGGLGWLGSISYSLYLVHEPLINLRDTALQHLPGGHTLRTALFVLWYTVPFVAAWLCWLCVEKPTMQISKRLKAAIVS